MTSPNENAPGTAMGDEGKASQACQTDTTDTVVKQDLRVARIHELHRTFSAQLRTSLETGIEIGRLLTEQKAKLKHGEWIPWCQANIEFSQASVTKYRALYRNRGKLLSGSNLGVNEAYRLTSAPEDDDDEEPRKRRSHVSNNSGEDEWYTPPEFINAAREVMGCIDVDVASSAVANQTVGAARFFTKEENGLEREWSGRVWMNPPYAQPLMRQFCEKLVEEFRAGSVTEAVVLTNNATDTGWFHELAVESSAVCLPKGRVRFLDPDGNPGAPLQGQAVLYLGENVGLFRQHFAPLGAMLIAENPDDDLEVEIVEAVPQAPAPAPVEVESSVTDDPLLDILAMLPQLTQDQREELTRILVTRWNCKGRGEA